jgi:glycosyltransferase involved in cell wall biosynthesis
VRNQPSPETITGYVEHIDGDTLSGWAFSSTGAPLRFALVIEGRITLFHLLRRERDDVRQAHPGADPCSGFMLKASSAEQDWLQALKDGQLALEINGQPVPLADPGAVGTASVVRPEAPAPLPPKRSSAALRQWEALRRVNASVALGAGIAESARAVCTSMQLEAPELENLMQSLAPRLCATADAVSLEALGEISLIPPGGLQSVHNPWRAGLAILGWCLAGQPLEAIRGLRRMAAMQDSPDWLPTECLHHAMRTVAARADSIPPHLLRLLVHGFLGVARAQQNRWFSRLHDRHLLGALTIALDLAQKSDDPAFSSAVQRALLRTHGLCPGFWQQIDPSVGKGEILGLARRHWQCIADSVAHAPGEGPRLTRAGPALKWFAALGNTEAAQFMRDIANHHRISLDPAMGSHWLRPSYARPDQQPCAGEICPAGGAPLPRHGLLVICVIRNEELLLPHFLRHYRALGAPHFVFVDNGSTDGSIALLRNQPDVTLFSAAAAYRDADFGVAWQQAVLANHCLGRWVLVVDADEMLVYDDCESRSLPGLISQVDSEGFDAVFTDLVDMYPRGSLDDADFSCTNPFDAAPFFDSPALSRWYLGSGRFSNAPSYVSSLRHRLAADAEPNAFLSQKCALFRYAPWVRLGHGLHDVANLNPAPARVWLAHFKYHAAFARKVSEEIARAQHFGGAREYHHYARMLEVNAGLWREGVSVRYEGSQSFRRFVMPHPRNDVLSGTFTQLAGSSTCPPRNPP